MKQAERENDHVDRECAAALLGFEREVTPRLGVKVCLARLVPRDLEREADAADDLRAVPRGSQNNYIRI